MRKSQPVLQDSESDKKSWYVLALQMIFLISSLVLILWAQNKLKEMSKNSSETSLERKAEFLTEPLGSKKPQL